MWYRESEDGVMLEEGINEAGAFSAWIALATSYANNSLPMIPFYIYYSMFGFHEIQTLSSKYRMGSLEENCWRKMLLVQSMQKMHQPHLFLLLASRHLLTLCTTLLFQHLLVGIFDPPGRVKNTNEKMLKK